jgi:ubiquinone/menaquinone biosynthesis C-methylase UbiE
MERKDLRKDKHLWMIEFQWILIVFVFPYFLFRGFFTDPEEKVQKLGVQEGQTVVDYGCADGFFTIAAAKVVGDRGRVYGCDIRVRPWGLESVERKARRQGLGNVETILTDCETGLPEQSVDLIYVSDAFHEFKDKPGVLKEFHRILKPTGVLSFDEHEMRENKFLKEVLEPGLFDLARKVGRSIYFFKKRI